MTGLQYGEEQHAHSEMESAATAYVNAIIKNPNGKLSPVWKKGFDGIIDAYLENFLKHLHIMERNILR